MAYEYEESNKQIVFTVDNESSMNQLNERIKELEEVYRKAKAFDEIKEFITRKLKEEEEKRPRTLLSDYDEGLYKACDSVDDIIQEYVERADDER
jgi:guanylate kinase